MRKIWIILLALVLALFVCAPALAFTSDTGEDPPFRLDAYLVDYEDDDFFGFASLPKGDRGYVKNEIVAWVIELHVEKGQNPFFLHWMIEATGEDVSFDIVENQNYRLSSNMGPFGVPLNITDEKITGLIGPDTFNAASEAQTYKMLLYAKITGDDPSITAELVDGIGNMEFGDAPVSLMTLEGVQYAILKHFDSISGDEDAYLILIFDGDYAGAAIELGVDKNHATTSMKIATPSSAQLYALVPDLGGDIGVFVDGSIKTSGSVYNGVMAVYEDVVVDVFGLDYMKIGNSLRDSFFDAITSPDTLSDTIEMKPFTPYVSVPEELVMDPPKTGGAPGLIGPAMVALSAVCAFALNKRR